MGAMLTHGLGEFEGGAVELPAALPDVPVSVRFGPDAQELPAVDYGRDVLVFPDLDETLTLVGDRRVLGEAIARRLMTETGTLAFHPNYGFNLRRYLNRPLRTAELAEIKSGVEDQCEDDERVLSAECAPEYSFDLQTLRVPIELETADGPFTLVALVDKLNLTLLAPEGT